MPDALAEKIRKAKTSTRATTKPKSSHHPSSTCSGTPSPQKLRHKTPTPSKQALTKAGLQLPYARPRYRSTYFAHIWGGGYAAGYYAYQWAETLEDRAIAWFESHGGLTRPNGDRLRTMVLSRGNTEDLAQMFENWIADEKESVTKLSSDPS